MLPSSSNSHQELTPPLGTAYVYLLASQQHPGTFKLGVTTHPAARFDALTKRFGKFDLQSSQLVVATNRRAALDLEGVLQTVFSASTWRAKPQLPSAKKACALRSDGDNEWYQMAAFDLMSTFISGMIEQDKTCAFHRFRLVRNIQDSDLWRERLRNAGVQTRFRTAEDIELDAQEKLEQSEAKFEAVQAWMHKRQHQLVSVTPFASDDQGNRQRTFVFRAASVPDPSSNEVDGGGWEDLAVACIVSYCFERSSVGFSYFGGVTVPCEDASTYQVEFLVTPAFARASNTCPMLRDLLTRIINWLDAPPLPL